MIHKIKAFFKVISNAKFFYKMFFYESSYFFEKKILQYSKKSLNELGKDEILPWLPLPLVEFLDSKLNKTFNIFEFGAGLSTIWFFSKNQNVFSIDSDKTFIESLFVGDLEKYNKNILIEENSEAFSEIPIDNPSKFEIIFIDAEQRYECAVKSLPRLSSNGVIILDNSDRPEYKNIFDFYSRHGFREITFTGIGIINNYAWSSTIFYRDNNIFQI